jgi:hypothetical protein
MTFEEAIKKVAEVLDVTENEEVFEALKGGEANSGEWEEKYNELKKKYTERFIDEITKPEEKKEEKEKEEKEEIKIDDLDFDGSTE